MACPLIRPAAAAWSRVPGCPVGPAGVAVETDDFSVVFTFPPPSLDDMSRLVFLIPMGRSQELNLE